MYGYTFREKKEVILAGIGVLVFLVIILGVSKYFSSPHNTSLPPETQRSQLEAAKQEGYDLGRSKGYQEGYEAARKDIGWRAGFAGFVLGVLLSAGGFAAINRKTLSEKAKTLRKKYELKKAFDTIPSNLPSDVYATAEQIARAYINISEQLRSAKGYTIAEYIDQWRPKLKELMKKAVQLMGLIQDLENARTNVDAQKLDRTITDLRYTARRARNDDTRNAAIKSLKRAKQTQNDLQRTNLNLEHCKTALQGITGVLESMHLKISNLKVNTQKTGLLDELSSDLEVEMAALEEALQEFATD